jgi:hypothetical protein
MRDIISNASIVGHGFSRLPPENPNMTPVGRYGSTVSQIDLVYHSIRHKSTAAEGVNQFARIELLSVDCTVQRRHEFFLALFVDVCSVV